MLQETYSYMKFWSEQNKPVDNNTGKKAHIIEI